MKKWKRILSLFFAALMLSVGIVPSVHAANACVTVSGSAANCDQWKSITVETGKNWASNKLTFTQTKGYLRHSSSMVDMLEKYGAYTIKVYNHSTKETQTCYWKYKESYTLKLKDNTKYTIKIKPYQPKTVAEQQYRLYRLWNHENWYWNVAPTWRIKSTKAVNWCYSS